MSISERLTSSRARLVLYTAAEAAILTSNQEYKIDDRSFKRADLAEIRLEIRRLESEIERLESRTSRRNRVFYLTGR